MDRAGNICGIEMEHTVITVAKYCRRMLRPFRLSTLNRPNEESLR